MKRQHPSNPKRICTNTFACRGGAASRIWALAVVVATFAFVAMLQVSVGASLYESIFEAPKPTCACPGAAMDSDYVPVIIEDADVPQTSDLTTYNP